jgi:hypothetical protein
MSFDKIEPMKKIFLLMLMLSPFANADMDKMCVIKAPKDVDVVVFMIAPMANEINKLGCDRNNILLFEISMQNREVDMSATFFQYASALWCRHDRNEKVVNNLLRCVLYDNKPRKQIVGSF